MRNIHSLATEVNAQIGEANESSLIVPLIYTTRDVLIKIGVEYTCDIVENAKISVENNRACKPSDLVQLIDVGYSENCRKTGMQHGVGYRVDRLVGKGYLPFSETIKHLVFDKSLRVEHVFIDYYAFYKDEEGVIEVPDPIWSACLEYGVAKLLDTRPTLPDFRNRVLRAAQAERQISEARAELHGNSRAAQRFRRNIK